MEKGLLTQGAYSRSQMVRLGFQLGHFIAPCLTTELQFLPRPSEHLDRCSGWVGTNSQQEGFLGPSMSGQESNLELITQWGSKQGLGLSRPKKGVWKWVRIWRNGNFNPERWMQGTVTKRREWEWRQSWVNVSVEPLTASSFWPAWLLREPLHFKGQLWHDLCEIQDSLRVKSLSCWMPQRTQLAACPQWNPNSSDIGLGDSSGGRSNGRGSLFDKVLI